MIGGRSRRGPQKRRPPFCTWPAALVGAGLAAAVSIGVFIKNDRAGLGAIRTVHAELPGIDLSGLDGAQVQQVLEASKQERCPCGCKFSLADCRVRDRTCARSGPILAEMVERFRRHGGDPSNEADK